MERLSSLVTVRVAAEVALFTTLLPVLTFLVFWVLPPATLLETAVPTEAATDAVTAVTTALASLPNRPPPLADFYSVSLACASAAASSSSLRACASSTSNALSRSTGVSYFP